MVLLLAGKSPLVAFKNPSFPLHRAAILLLHMVHRLAGQRHVVTGTKRAPTSDQFVTNVSINEAGRRAEI